MLADIVIVAFFHFVEKGTKTKKENARSEATHADQEHEGAKLGNRAKKVDVREEQKRLATAKKSAKNQPKKNA